MSSDLIISMNDIGPWKYDPVANRWSRHAISGSLESYCMVTYFTENTIGVMLGKGPGYYVWNHYNLPDSWEGPFDSQNAADNHLKEIYMPKSTHETISHPTISSEQHDAVVLEVKRALQKKLAYYEIINAAIRELDVDGFNVTMTLIDEMSKTLFGLEQAINIVNTCFDDKSNAHKS